MAAADFSTRLADCAARSEAMLDRLLDGPALPGEIARPKRLIEAMCYATLGGGKRIRPFLLMESARLFAAEGEGIVRAGAALELVHCYSLAHDDLPAMDDDDIRRGRASLHRAFDEATAILAGDALLTLAFDVLADPETHSDAAMRAELVAMLARAAGLGGMAGGQMLDLLSETADEAAILRMQGMKTGALFRFACEAGAVLGRARADERARLAEFGARLGTAFQLADDIVDTAGEISTTTRVLQGAGRAQALLQEEEQAALALLLPFGPRGAILAETVRFVAGSAR
jgi:farnesyl diphosphate synthase